MQLLAFFALLVEGLENKSYKNRERIVINISIFNKQTKPSNDAVNSFCHFYVMCGSAAEAARRSNLDELTGLELLNTRRVRRKINTIYERTALSTLFKARSGLERIAFGRINDAAEIALSENDSDYSRFDGYDLYNVSEIKKVKGGGVEIKFFDRLKAIEQLTALNEMIASKSDSDRFLSALERTVNAGSETNDDS